MQKVLFLAFFIFYFVFGWKSNQHLNQMEYLCRLYGVTVFELFDMSTLKFMFRTLYLFIGSGLVVVFVWRNYELGSVSK